MKRTLDVVTLILVLVGAINWLLVGLFRFDLVAAIAGLRFGEINGFNATVYVLVGIAALYQAGLALTMRRPRASHDRPTRLAPR